MDDTQRAYGKESGSSEFAEIDDLQLGGREVMLAGKTALVTGAARGIGKGCAIELARAGANLLINDRPRSADIDGVAHEIRRLGRDCAAVEVDGGFRFKDFRATALIPARE